MHINIFYVISSTVTTIASFALGIFVFLKAPRHATNRAWFLMSISVAIWSAGFCLMISGVSDRANTLFFDRISHIGAIFIPVFYLYFVLTLLDKVKKYKRVTNLGFVFAFVLLIFVFSKWFIVDVVPKLSFKYYPIPGILYHFFTFMFLSFVIFAQYLMLKDLKSLPGIIKNQIKYVLVASSLGFLGGATTFPLVYDIPLLPLGGPLVFIYTVVISMAIIKYNLMALNVAVKELTAKISSFLTLGIMAFFGAFLVVKFTGIISKIVAMIVAMVSMAIFYSLHSRLQLLISRKLRPRQDFQAILKDYTEVELMAQHTSKGLAELVVQRIADTLRPTVCSLMLLDKDSGLYNVIASSGKDEEIKTIAFKQNSHLIMALENAHQTRLIVKDELSKIFTQEQADLIRRDLEILKSQISIPLILQGELLGLLSLGIKTSGELYTPEEMGFLYIFLAQSGFMMEFLDKMQRIHELEVKAEKLAGMTNLLTGFEHEINNQMIPTQTYLNLEDESTLSEDMKNFRKSALGGFENITMILNSVRDYCESADVRYPSLTDIKDSIISSLEKFKNKFASINVKITTDIPANLPKAETFLCFKHLFPNLFRNCYYGLSQRKTRLLDIKAYQTKDAQRPLEIVIKDTGGDLLNRMDRKALSSGGEDAPERSGIGGINFFIAKLIVNDHQGELQVSTNLPPVPDEQAGTIFTIKLPLTQPKK